VAARGRARWKAVVAAVATEAGGVAQARVAAVEAAAASAGGGGADGGPRRQVPSLVPRRLCGDGHGSWRSPHIVTPSPPPRAPRPPPPPPARRDSTTCFSTFRGAARARRHGQAGESTPARKKVGPCVRGRGWRADWHGKIS
jgi:hypothetical protein